MMHETNPVIQQINEARKLIKKEEEMQTPETPNTKEYWDIFYNVQALLLKSTTVTTAAEAAKLSNKAHKDALRISKLNEKV